jgi:PAS domain S-box-containing protein
VLKEQARSTEEPTEHLAPDIPVPGKVKSVVKESQDKYHFFFEQSRDSLLTLDAGGSILEANPAACAAFQMTAVDICDAALSSIIDVEDTRFARFTAESRRAGKAMAEVTCIRSDGTLFPAEITSSIYQSEQGVERTSVIIRDLTGQRKVVEGFIKPDQLYSDLFQLSPQPMWVLETETFRFIQVNKAAMDLYGYSSEEFMSMTLMDIKPREDMPQAKANIKRRTAGYGVSRDTFRHYKKSGETIEVEIYSNPLVVDDKTYLLVIASDVTEKNMQEHRIIKAIIQAQEEERYEISNELHENVCQILATSQLSLSMLKEAQDPSGASLVKQSKKHIAQATRAIRKLSHRLAPAFHDFTTLKQEFVTLLKWLDPEDKYKIGLHVDDAVTQYNIGLDLKLNLYRILQEQLKNTFQHADCTTIDVKILVQDNKLRLIISDDGIGFEPGAARDGIGLSSIKRRASLFAGTLEVDSTPGKGCTVSIDIPLPPSAAQAKA